MQKFLEFKETTDNEDILSEAAVGAGNVEKAISLIVKVLEKRLATKLFRYGGKAGQVQYSSKGTGFLFFASDLKGIRINYEGGKLNSVSIWKKYKTESKADFTVDIGKLNMIQTIDALADIIKSPRPGKLAFAQIEESASVNGKLITEAKRVDGHTFYELVSPHLGPGVDPTRLQNSEIAELALKAGVNIPGSIWKDGKVARGLYSIVPNGRSRATGETIADYITVSNGDSKTKSFVSGSQNRDATAASKLINQTIKDPSLDVVKKEMKSANTLFRHMADLVTLVAKGSRNALIILGGPGIGKTYVVTKTLEEKGLSKDKGWFLVKGRITTAALYNKLFMHRDKGQILVFDDTDSIWNDKDASNILKAALDSYDQRIISWHTTQMYNVSLMSQGERDAYNKELDTALRSGDVGDLKYPNEFEYKGRIIFISNLTMNKLDTAVLNRSMKIDMTLTQEQIYERIRTILEHLGPSSISMDQKNEILDFLIDRGANLTVQTSMRTFMAATDCYMSGLPNWKELIDYQ